jgi:hypothetical protein
MRLLITLIGWCEYPSDRHIPAPHLWDLRDSRAHTNLIVLFGNGAIGELRAESENTDALHLLQRIISGPGACQAHQLTDDKRRRVWLYQPGDECYIQVGEPPGYIFVNPQPQPDLFARLAS